MRSSMGYGRRRAWICRGQKLATRIFCRACRCQNSQRRISGWIRSNWRVQDLPSAEVTGSRELYRPRDFLNKTEYLCKAVHCRSEPTVVCDPGHGPVIEDLWKLNFGDAGHPCAAACCLYIAPRVNRFRTVFDPFFTVFHRFCRFCRFCRF